MHVGDIHNVSGNVPAQRTWNPASHTNAGNKHRHPNPIANRGSQIMKKSKTLIIIGITLLLAILTSYPAGVQAYQALTSTPSAQPTITAPPGYNPMVNTPFSPSSLDCPDDGSNPIGWGTVTPSSGWMMLCSQCVNQSEWGTSTPSNTKTPNPTFVSLTQAACQTAAVGGEPCYTATPYPTGTATTTPTISVTGTPVSGGFKCNGLYGSSCFAGEVTSYEHNFTMPFDNNSSADVFNINIPNTPNGQQIIIYYRYEVTSTWVGAHPNYSPYIAFRTWISYPASNWGGWLPYPVTYWGGWHSSPTAHEDGQRGVSGSFPVQRQGTMMVAHYQANTFGGINLNFSFKNNNVGWDAGTNPLLQGTLYISLVGYPTTPTPTPTATPSNLGYCESVSSVESGFSWSGITYGETRCFDIGPYGGFDFGGLTSNPIGEMPWLAHICLQDVSFGDVTVFDVIISLEAILYILGIAAVIRNLFVS